MRRRLSLRRVASLGIAALCGAYIVHYFLGHQEDIRALSQLTIEAVLGLTALRLAQYGLQSVRHHLIVQKCSGTRIPFRTWLEIYTVGQFMNFMVAQSGNVYRSIRLKQGYGIPYAQFVGSVLFAAWIGIGTSLLLAAIMLGADPAPKFAATEIAALLAIALLGLVVVPPLLARLTQSLSFSQTRLAWMHGRLTEILRTAFLTVADLGGFARLIGLSMAIFALTCAALRLGFYGFGVDVGTAEVVLFAVLLQISTLVIVTPGNLGIQEVLFALLGLYLDTGIGQAMLISALLRVLDFTSLSAMAIPMGGITALRRRRDHAA